jgi:NTE family protein
MVHPLSPVIRLGAEKIFAIGVRCDEERLDVSENESSPSLAQVMGVVFNVMFLDHLVTDLEHLERLNRLLESGHLQQDVDECEECEKIRPLSTLLITPSVHLSDLAKQHYNDMPYLIQYFVSSLGRNVASCADLMSYLLFASRYTRDLIAIGYHDADKRIGEIEEFLFSGDGNGRSPGTAAKGTRNRGLKRC